MRYTVPKLRSIVVLFTMTLCGYLNLVMRFYGLLRIVIVSCFEAFVMLFVMRFMGFSS